MLRTTVLRGLCLLVGLAALALVSGPAEGKEPCTVDISYADQNVEPGGSGSALPSLSLGYCAEIDDPRSYNITSTGGFPGSVTINSFNGRVNYTADSGAAAGTYTITVSATWNCVCSTGGDSDSFTIEVC